jgi:acyl carrier protein
MTDNQAIAASRTLTADQQAMIDVCYESILPGVRVTEEESFFDAGGDSIQLVHLVQLVQAKLGTSIRLSDFLYSPTRAALAEAIVARLPHD